MTASCAASTQTLGDLGQDVWIELLLLTKVRLGNVAGQASTLNQLGNLYDDFFNRPEEAAAFYRQAVDRSVESGDVAKEGLRRNNLANTLRKLRRLDDAPQQIRRAIECDAQFGHASEPWKAWAILADIETDAGNPSAAAEAKGKAIECYLAYRRDGGENHYADGRICLAVTEPLLAGDPAAAASLLQQVAADPNLPSYSAPSSKPSKPSSPAAATAPSPTPRTWILDGRRNPLPARQAGESREVKTRGTTGMFITDY